MKIALSTTSIENSLNGGIVDGIGHYTEQVYDGLNKRGKVVIPYAFPPLFRKAKTEKSCPFPRPYLIQLLKAKTGIFSPLRIPADIFHVTDFRSVPMDIPVVSTMWDAIPVVHPEWIRSGWQRHVVPIISKQSAKYPDKIICASEHAAQDILQHYKVPSEKIAIIPWSISIHWQEEIDQTRKQEVLSKYRLNHDYVLTVGSLRVRKNIDRLIDAFLQIPTHNKTKDLKLVVVGKKVWGSENTLKKIEAHSDKIIHLDQVNNDEELRAIYQSARVVAFPSLYEGFGMPALEAFASKVPLVASNLTSIPEVVGDSALLFNPLSIEAITKALTEVLLHDDVAKDLTNKGWERLKLFDGDHMIDRLIALYTQVIST